MVCFECGSLAQCMHHVVPRSRGGTRTLPLCEGCHDKVHGVDRLSISALTSEALRHKQSRGEYIGGRVPYGYRLAPCGVSLVEDEAEQQVLTAARSARASGLSLRAVARLLHSRGMDPRHGPRWYPTQISRMVR